MFYKNNLTGWKYHQFARQTSRQRTVRHVGPLLEQPLQDPRALPRQAQPGSVRSNERKRLRRPQDVPDRKWVLPKYGAISGSGYVLDQFDAGETRWQGCGVSCNGLGLLRCQGMKDLISEKKRIDQRKKKIWSVKKKIWSVKKKIWSVKKKFNQRTDN